MASSPRTIGAIIYTSLQIGFSALSNIGALDLLIHFNYSVGLAVVLNTVSALYPTYKAALFWFLRHLS